MTSLCTICKRKLGVCSDPLSADCGGDCWGCIGEIEADAGHEPSTKIVREEYRNGLRPDWQPTPIVVTEPSIQNKARILVTLRKPLGEPWAYENFGFTIYTKSAGDEIDLFHSTFKTDSKGTVSVQFQLPSEDTDVWYRITRSGNKWCFPITQTMNT